MFVQMPAAFAGTTGSIGGTLTDTSGKAIADAKVTAASPSQTATASTDRQGRYVFVSLAPDTYVLTFEKAGYEVGAQRGVTVQADQNISIDYSIGLATKTIGRTTSGSASTLVRAGQTASTYSITPALAGAAASLGGGTNLTSAYSAVAAVPGVQTGTSNTGVTQSVLIRGGSYDQTGYEFDGVPLNRAFDQYNNSSLPLLGTAQTQVYTGNAPAGSQANGSAGFINQVVKSGTYPGFVTAQYGFSSPGENNNFLGEFGGATKNGLLSFYFGAAGQEQHLNLANQWNGAGFLAATGNGTIYNIVAAGCGTAHPTVGCYQNAGTYPNFSPVPFGPNGFAVADTLWGFQPQVYQRQDIANIHIGIPHKDGSKDDIQLLWDYNVVSQNLGNMNAWGNSLTDVVNGTAYNGTVPNGACPAADFGGAYVPVGTTPVAGPVACFPAVQPFYQDYNRYTGPVQAQLTTANLNNVTNVTFPYSPPHALGAAVPNNDTDNNTNEVAITKIQYQHNISSKGYIRAYYYTLFSDWINPGPVAFFQNAAYDGSQALYTIASHTKGGVLDFGYQLNSENLITATAGYTQSDTLRYNNFTPAYGYGAPTQIAYLVSSANPGAGCYAVAGGAAHLAACASGAGYVLAPVDSTVGACGQALCPKNAASPVLGTENTISCGGAPCAYYAVSDGTQGSLNTVTPKFFNASLSDQFKPTSKLTIDASLRLDTFSYDTQPTNVIGNQLFVASYNATHCISGTTIKGTVGGVYGGPCPAGYSPTTLTAQSSDVTFADILQPRVGVSFQATPLDVIKASYGRFTQAPPTYTIQGSTSVVNYFQATTPSAPYYADFGANSEIRNTLPEYSYNTDFTWEHQLHGTDVSFQVTPFLRKSQNSIINIPVDPTNPNFITGVNGAGLTAQGVEFALNKGDFNRDGWAAHVAFTYTWATDKYYIFPSTGGSLLTSANQAIATYNQYTSFCTQNPNDSRCSTAGVPPGTVTGAACYLNGAPSACGVAGAVANPYWNAPAQGLLDLNAAYPAYNGYLASPGGGGTSVAYVVPYVVSLVAQYKHKALRVAPSLQIYSGDRYGTPLSTEGVAPDTCSALGNSVTSDPRYSFGTAGQAGASGYDAASCSGAITIPDPANKNGSFDSIGGFTQPTLLDFNLQLGYDFDKHFSVNLIGSNLFVSCFGGSQTPWLIQGRNGCGYAANGQPAGNFYNPGDYMEPGFQYSYAPIIGPSGQSLPQGSVPPTQLTVEFTYKGF